MRKSRWLLVVVAAGLLILLAVQQSQWFDDAPLSPVRPHRLSPDRTPPAEPPGNLPTDEAPDPGTPTPADDGEGSSSTAEGESSTPTEEESAARQVRVLRLTEGWASAVLHPGLDSLKLRTLEEMLTALKEEGGEKAEAAMYTLARTLTAEFDRAPFRDAVIGYLDSESELMRSAALFALAGLRPGPEYMKDVTPLLEDPSPRVRGSLTYVLRSIAGKKIEGAMEEPFLQLLRDRDPHVARGAMSAMGNMEVPESISNELLELSRSEDPVTRHHALTYGLAQLEGKAEAVVDALIVLMDHESFTESHQAAKGLETGVPEELQRRVADAALESMAKQANLQMKVECLTLVRLYGEEKHAAALEILAEAEDTHAAVRQHATIAIKVIRNR